MAAQLRFREYMIKLININIYIYIEDVRTDERPLCNTIRHTINTNVKHLGCLVFDSNIDWEVHIQQLKFKCNKTKNLMRSVSSTEKTLMMIYGSLISFKIEYGSIVYNSASSKELQRLESVSNEAIRITSGCFKSTPVSIL